MMHRYKHLLILSFFSLLLLGLVVFISADPTFGQTAAEEPVPSLLTDPFLQLPTEDSVRVVWFTEFQGEAHRVTYGDDLDQTVEATTTKLSRMFEDQKSRVGEQVEDGQIYKEVTPRDIWRHEAVVEPLTSGERVPYYVTSQTEAGELVQSEEFSLAPLPEAGEALKILLTSDHQLKPMTPANLQKVVETVGRVDAVFFAGDLINIPDRASEWFDDRRGLAFFPGLQGRTQKSLTYELEQGSATRTITATYTGGDLIQHAPLFPVIGNHEVMGRFKPQNDLNSQYNDPHPRQVAEERYELYADLYNPQQNPEVREHWLRDNSFNSISYEEIFTLPDDGPAGEQYYALQFGDVYLIGLYATRIWRTPVIADEVGGKYQEAKNNLNTPGNWGYGEFIFEDLAEGSTQYDWLVEELNSAEFQGAPVKVVMLHHPIHSVGDNITPPFAHPVRIIDRAKNGAIETIRYEYPIEDSLLIRDIEPLLEAAGVDLVFYGHSHVWYRFRSEAGVNYLETSNVGNNYGCYLTGGERERWNVPADEQYDAANYFAAGNPHGLSPITPTITAPMTDEQGNPLPCVASNEITVFSILDTGQGVVSSYFFDTRRPESEAVKFDEFSLQ